MIIRTNGGAGAATGVEVIERESTGGEDFGIGELGREDFKTGAGRGTGTGLAGRADVSYT